MNQTEPSPFPPIPVPVEDWEQTPACVKAWVVMVLEELEQAKKQRESLEERLARLEEQSAQTSENSSKPPSQDRFRGKKKESRPQSERQRGGQKGHEGKGKGFYPIERCEAVHEHYPSQCQCCGNELRGSDLAPQRHQVVELAPVLVKIEEHRLHQLECPHCGKKTRAKLPEGVCEKGYGERLTAFVGYVSSVGHQSHQQVVKLLDEVLDVQVSVGTVNRLRQDLSESLEGVVSEAQSYVQQAPVRHCDETGFPQHNFDGQNPQQKQGYLWVVVTPLLCWFEIALARTQQVAQSLLGLESQGIVVSDRYSSYNWIDPYQRQLCWAHLKRDFTAIAQRPGVAGELGQRLLALEREVFELWHQFRQLSLSRLELQERIQPLRRKLQVCLEEGAGFSVGYREQTPLAKTVRTCRQLLKQEVSLWTFVHHEGVEPTNNAAERSLRPAVIARKLSFGSRSHQGSLFVARLLTVTSSLKLQQRPILDFLTEACRAHRYHLTPPSLLPSAES